MEDMLDFDRFLAEKEKRTLPVRVMGKVYAVRPEFPAIVPILMARSEEMGEGDATRLVLKAADALFGKEAMDEIAGKGLTVEELAELVRQVFTRIQRQDEAEEIRDDDGRRRKKAGKE